jgi:hypothetical protein
MAAEVARVARGPELATARTLVAMMTRLKPEIAKAQEHLALLQTEHAQLNDTVHFLANAYFARLQAALGTGLAEAWLRPGAAFETSCAFNVTLQTAPTLALIAERTVKSWPTGTSGFGFVTLVFPFVDEPNPMPSTRKFTQERIDPIAGRCYMVGDLIEEY